MQPATAGLLLFPVIHAPGIPVHGRPTSYKGSKDEANPRDLLYSGRGTEACLGQVRLRGLRPCSFLPRGQGPQGSAHGGLCLQDGGPWLCRGRPAQIPAWEAEGAPASGRLLAVTPSCNGLWLLFLGAPRLGIAVGDPTLTHVHQAPQTQCLPGRPHLPQNPCPVLHWSLGGGGDAPVRAPRPAGPLRSRPLLSS